jgi:hypothetical protein
MTATSVQPNTRPVRPLLTLSEEEREEEEELLEIESGE